MAFRSLRTGVPSFHSQCMLTHHTSVLARTRALIAATGKARVIVRAYGNKKKVFQTASLGIGLACLSNSTGNPKFSGALFKHDKRGIGQSGGGSSKDDDLIDKIIDQVGGHVHEITFGGILGFCSGYAVKEIGKATAVMVGGLFVCAQMLSYHGYIDVKWKKVQQDVLTAVDPNKDGKITKDDLKIWWKKLMKLLKYNLPSSSGFVGGFILGISYN